MTHWSTKTRRHKVRRNEVERRHGTFSGTQRVRIGATGDLFDRRELLLHLADMLEANASSRPTLGAAEDANPAEASRQRRPLSEKRPMRSILHCGHLFCRGFGRDGFRFARGGGIRNSANTFNQELHPVFCTG
jgi:hypothetical protein